MANDKIQILDQKSLRLVQQAVADYLRRTRETTQQQRRYPRSVGNTTLVPFVLTEDVGATTSGQASANKLDWDGAAISPTESITVYDNLGIFAAGEDTANGYAVFKNGDYHIVQLECL